MPFWTCRKSGLIRKIGLISKFIKSRPGQQRITTDILVNISESKGNQTMKFSQFIQHPEINIFL